MRSADASAATAESGPTLPPNALVSGARPLVSAWIDDIESRATLT
jgi:hypothetical protein